MPLANLPRRISLAAAAGSRIVTLLNVQSLRRSRCRGWCTGSQRELRTTACTNGSKHSPQYQDDHCLRLIFLGGVKHQVHTQQASTDKEFTVVSGKRGHEQHLTFLNLDELLLLSERVCLCRWRDWGVAEPPAPIPGHQVAVLPGRGAPPAVWDWGFQGVALRVEKGWQDRRPGEAPWARWCVCCILVRSCAI